MNDLTAICLTKRFTFQAEGTQWDASIPSASLAKVAAAKDNLGKATVKLDKAIKAAHDKGASLRVIAEAASISYEKVRYIVK